MSTITDQITPPRRESFTAPMLSPEDFSSIARVMERESGVSLPAHKLVLAQSRLGRRLREHRLGSFAEYVKLVERDDGERKIMVDALTTNHTSFFREAHHFDHLERSVLPDLRREAMSRPVRFWSTASSSGEEVYTLAMVMSGHKPGDADWIKRGNVKILATDINADMVTATRAAEYPLGELQAIDPRYSAHWSAQGSTARISEKLRQLVTVERLNLFDHWPIACEFDVIFCRNVLIYFEADRRAQLLGRLAAQLRLGGHLYIGHSERLDADTARKFESLGQTIYRKVRQ